MKNTHVNPVSQSGGNRAKMPTFNQGKAKVTLGNSKGSTVAKAPATKAGNTPVKQAGSKKTALPTHNSPARKVNLGNTMHGVGQVPGYLQGK